jgi:hypothetical protein
MLSLFLKVESLGLKCGSPLDKKDITTMKTLKMFQIMQSTTKSLTTKKYIKM